MKQLTLPIQVDDSRVSLSPIPERDDCKNDYINASHVDVSEHINSHYRFVDS